MLSSTKKNILFMKKRLKIDNFDYLQCVQDTEKAVFRKNVKKKTFSNKKKHSFLKKNVKKKVFHR